MVITRWPIATTIIGLLWLLLLAPIEFVAAAKFKDLNCDFGDGKSCDAWRIGNAKQKVEKTYSMLTVEDELKPIEISATLNADEAETSTYCINLRHYHVEPQTRLLNVLSRSADGRLRLLTSRHEYVTPRFVNLYVQVETMATELIYQTEMSWIGVERIEVRAGACDKSYDCTFEPGEPCGWRSVLPITAMPDSLFEFKIRTCESMSEDVTTDRPDGHALISSNGMSEAEFKKNGYANGTAVAIFRSPSIKGGVDQHRCFTFYQYVKSLQHARLDLRPYFVNRHLTGEPIWSNVHSVQVDSLYQWQKVQLSLLFTSDMHLEFVAYNLPGSEVALDEISLRDGPCEPTPTCSFQNYDFCSYRSDDTNENRFLILHELPPNRKPKMSTEMAKHVRQLVKESQPFALFDVTMLSRLKTDFYYEAGVVSPLFSRQSSTCLRVEYSFMADDVSDSYFSIEFKQYRTFVTLLRDDEPQQFSGDWNQAEFTIPPGHNMKIKFLAAVHYSNESSVPMVAIKSVQSFKGDCESTVDSEPVEEFTCSFDDNACAYLYSSGSDLSWTRYDGSKPHPDLPNFDGNDVANGGYMYALESEITQDGSRYMLNSSIYKPDYRRRTNLYCLSFAYMIDCPVNRCALNVMKESNIMTIVRKLKPDEWNHYRMTFSHRGDFRMQFMANFYENSSGMIALDEIEVHTGSCLSQPNDGDRHVCDFEYDDCGWIPYHDPTQPNFKFTWADALHPATKDHTTGRNKGMVAAVEIGPNQRIKSPVLLMNQQSFDYSDELCVAFWMNVNVRNLRISLQTVDVSGEQPRSRTWWSVADQPAIDTWIPYFAQIKSDSVKSGYIQFALESTLKEKATDSASIGFLALDDVNVQQGRCPKTCTFEDTNCEWHQIQPSEFKYIDETNQEVIESSLNANWLITNALRHPIEHDRFQKSRHAKMNFLRLVTAKESAETNSSGLLRSSVHPLDSSNALCISFKHVMIDPVFEVQVLLAENAVAVPHTLHRIRPASDESGTDGTWKTNHYEVNADYAVKKFGLTSTPKQWLAYILVSQTARENGTVHNTNFGLANLNIRAQPCGAFDNKFKCDQFRMIPYSKMCDFHYDCEDKTDELNCSECRDFSDGLCGYEIAEPDDSSSSWQLYQSKTNDAAKTDISIKPTTVFDASVLPSGGFLYTQLNAERYSKLIGPVLENAHGTCELIVRYAVLNAHFKIDVEVAGQTWKLYKDCDYLNDSLDNDQLDDDITVTAAPVTTSRTVALKEVRLQIGRIDDWFELEFYASRGPSTNSSQSIGGVLLAQSQLVNCFQPEPTEGECGPDQFRCKNRVCINRDLVCDLNDDCGDTSDETMCNRRSREQRCSFESGTCELIPISQFVRSKAVDSLKRGPTRDHTDNSATGHYLLYSPDRTSSAESAELALPVLVDSGSCAMRWFASGRNVASVRLRYSDNDANDRLSYELPIPSDNRWTRQQVRLRDLGDISPFLSHLQVTLIKNATGGAYFALDDFTLTDSCYPHMATEMVCRFGEDASNGLCAWHLNRRADNVLGEVIRTEQELTQIRTDQAKLANPKDMLNSLWIHSVGQQESSGSLASKAKREQAEEQPAEDAQPTDATSSRKCDNCFELRSPLLTADNPQMMRLNVKYSLFGAQNTRIIIHTGDLSRPLLEVRDSSINLMNEHCIPLSQPSRTQFQLFLYAEVDSTSNAYVIWKEISIAVGECTKRATDRCDFDSLSRCESVPRIGSINEFRSSLERSPVGFPLYDHTRHSPKSAFVYAQQSQKISKHFLLQEYSYDSNYCLSFWYTSGTTVSSAPNRLNGRLSIKPFDSFAHRHVKFESAVNRALEWQLVAFQVKGVEYDSLEIEAQFDGEQELLIALDDLLLERGACKLGFDCDFDLYDPLYGMCGWHVKFGDTLQPNLTPPKWLRMVAKQIDSESFPVNDFDRNSATIQGFMFASLAPNDRRSVRMQSPLISIAREGRCLCFAYFAPTRSKLVLQIHLEQGAARRKVISFQPNATVRNDWHLVKVDLAPFNAVQPASTATKTQDNGDGDDDDSSDEEDDVQTDGFNDDWSMVVIEAVNSDLLTPKPRLDAIDNSIAIDDIHLLDLPCAEYERGYDQISLQDLYDPIHDLYDEEEEDGDSWNNNSSSSDSSRSNAGSWWIVTITVFGIVGAIGFVVYRRQLIHNRYPQLQLPRVSMINILQNENPEV